MSPRGVTSARKDGMHTSDDDLYGQIFALELLKVCRGVQNDWLHVIINVNVV